MNRVYSVPVAGHPCPRESPPGGPMKLTKHGRRLVRTAFIALLVPVVALTGAPGSAADPGDDPSQSSGTRLAESPSSRLAQTDPSLLGKSGTAPVSVVVKLGYDATASYRGGVAGYAATSPSVTGRALTGKSAAERSYQRYIAAQEDAFVTELRKRVPQARIG